MRTPLALFENLLYDLTLFVSMFTSHDLHYDVSIIDRYWTNVILSDGIVVSELSFLLLSCFGILIIDWYLN